MLPAFGAAAPLEDFALEAEDLAFDPEGLFLEDDEDRARAADDFVFDPADFARDPEPPLLRACDPLLRACDPFELRLLVLRLLARDELFLLVEVLPELRPADRPLEDFVLDCAILSLFLSLPYGLSLIVLPAGKAGKRLQSCPLLEAAGSATGALRPRRPRIPLALPPGPRRPSPPRHRDR